MQNFSQRNGHVKVEEYLQREFVSDRVRTQVWHFFYTNGFHRKEIHRYTFFKEFWMDFCCKPVDQDDMYFEDLVSEVRALIFDAPWNEFFDFIEFISAYKKSVLFPEAFSSDVEDSMLKLTQGVTIKDAAQAFMKSVPKEHDNSAVLMIELNRILERENSAYRIIGGLVQEITNPMEIEEIQKALDNNPYKPCRGHLQRALELMSDRDKPDFRNSIKESISAVESLAKTVTGEPNATLGKVLKDKKNGQKLNPQLKEAFKKLYAWTNGPDGIRHAMMEDPNLTLADARFMLIACSAFVNYVIDAYKEVEGETQ